MHMFDFLVTLALGIFIGSTFTISIAYSLEQRVARKLREKQPVALRSTNVGMMSLVKYPPIDRSEPQFYDQETDTVRLSS